MADQLMPPEDELTSDEQSPTRQVSWETIGREASLLVKILVPLLIGGVIVSVVFLGGVVAGVGIFVASVLMLFISLPLWLASMEDDFEEHDHSGESQRVH